MQLIPRFLAIRLLCILFMGCNNDDGVTDTLFESLLGKWQLTEAFISAGGAQLKMGRIFFQGMGPLL